MSTHRSPAEPRQPVAIDWHGSVLIPAAAAFATICASSALTGIIAGWAWLSYVLVAVVLVSCTGLGLRAVSAPPLAVGLAQLGVLLFLVTGMFTESGILAVIPGPGALSELGDVLAASGDAVRTSVPPVEATAPILCLITIGIGMVAVLVDTLAVSASAPAATGLVLLCLYAVPASLANEMLPWWTFVLGASAFTVLIAVDGGQRHRGWRSTPAPDSARLPEVAAAPAGVVGLAVVVGLLAGSAFTAIGTVGQLPGSGPGGGGTFTGGLGVRPFTSLRGMLNRDNNSEMFRVSGLGTEKRLLRAFTLDTYRPNEGWSLANPGSMPAGVPANGPLPSEATSSDAKVRDVRITPVNWLDVWLPVYGDPQRIAGISGQWFFDPSSGTAFSERRQRPPPYVVTTSFTEPNDNSLRAASAAPDEIAPVYTEINGIDPRVVALTDRITKDAGTTFDKAAAIWRHMTQEGRFTYDTTTAIRSDNDALADFLLKGRRGFCEQFASAMAVMLRSEGIPSRVAVGFTAGVAAGRDRSITARDAHAWVEVYFGSEQGWVVFDPTPLDDGRSSVPDYLAPQNGENPEDFGTRGEETPETPGQQPRTPEGVEADAGGGTKTDEGAGLASAPVWARWSTLLIVLLAAALTVATVPVTRRAAALRAEAEMSEDREKISLASRWLPLATAGSWLLSIGLLGWMVSWLMALALLIICGGSVAPALLREFHRGRRLHDVTMSRPAAPNAAWEELLDECADRGTAFQRADTVRESARRLAIHHRLDDEGRQHLSTVVAVMERTWYGTDAGVDAQFAAAFEGLRQSLNRAAPLSWQGKLLPRSVIKR